MKSRVLAVSVLAAAAIASAAPCIECNACTTDNCRKSCSRTCPPPSPPTVDLERCKRAGREAGARVAKESCDTTLLFCRGGQKPQPRAFAAAQVSRQQCANVAFGECQNVAKNRALSPCGRAFNGIDQCKAADFQGFYNGEVDERCNNEADKIERNGP